jgi:hypothetical protein
MAIIWIVLIIIIIIIMVIIMIIIIPSPHFNIIVGDKYFILYFIE